MKLTIYGTDGCHLCEEVTKCLDRREIKYRYIDIADDEALMKLYGWYIPVIEFQEQVWKSPFNIDEVLEELSFV